MMNETASVQVINGTYEITSDALDEWEGSGPHQADVVVRHPNNFQEREVEYLIQSHRRRAGEQYSDDYNLKLGLHGESGFGIVIIFFSTLRITASPSLLLAEKIIPIPP